jgi:tRNA-dihydrouridine synthase A
MTAESVVESMKPYIADELAKGVWLQHITRHMLGLFHAKPGGKHWRRVLSEEGTKPGAGLATIDKALSEVTRRTAQLAVAAE